MGRHLAAVKEEDDEQTLVEYVSVQLNEKFIENIPIGAILELPPFFMYLFGAIAEILMLITFIFYFKSVYDQGMSEKFISLQNNTGICEPVTKSINGEYDADTQGNWAGTADYSASLSLYQLLLTDAAFTHTTYETVMLMSYAALLQLGEIGKKQDLAGNIAVFITWQMICREIEDQFTAEQNAICNNFADSQQLFVFSALSNNVFDIGVSVAALSDVDGTCNCSSFTSYDLGVARTIGNFYYTDYITSPDCIRIANPPEFGFNADVDDVQFKIAFDVRTFGDSVGINAGYLSSSELEYVGNSPSTEFEFQGVNYTAQSYIDTVYVGMDPLYCVTNTSEIEDMSKGVIELCFLQLSNIYGIPIFNHYGNAGSNPQGMQTPQFCACLPMPYGYGFEDYCDEFDLMTGVIFYQETSTTLTKVQQLQAGISLMLRNGNFSSMNANAYNASFSAVATASNPASVVDPIMASSEWRSAAYDFCNIEGYGTCSVYAVRSYGDTLVDKSTTSFLYQLTNGSCADPFSIPAPLFDQLVQNPPTPITEKFFQCTLTELDAVNNAIGIASGNTTTIVPVAVLLLLPFIYLWLKAFNIPIPVPEYPEEQRKDVSEFFITTLMRANDKKTRGMKKNGVLLKLVKELRHADQYGSKDACDSDDSDEDYSDDESSDRPPSPSAERKPPATKHTSPRRASALGNRGFLSTETREQLAVETNPMHQLRRRLSVLAIPETDEENFSKQSSRNEFKVVCCSNEIFDIGLVDFIVTFIEDNSSYSMAVHHEKCNDDAIVVGRWDKETDPQFNSRTINFVKMCNLPDLEQAPATKKQRWWECGEVGTVICSSTTLENVPNCDIFTVEDCLIVKSVSPDRVSVSVTMDVSFMKESEVEQYIFDNVSREMVAWYKSYIAALRGHIQLRSPSSLSSPMRNSFQHRFSQGHDEVEDSDDEHDHDHDNGMESTRSAVEIELSQL